jgi:uncharacterized membrane protein
MQTKPTTLAAVAGGLLLLRHMNKRRRSDTLSGFEDTMDRDAQSHGMGKMLGLAALVGGGLYLSNTMRSSPGADGMSNVIESIELGVPASTAYNQWTQFEDFPRFMATVEQVTQLDDTHLHWRAVVGGKAKEWDAEITEQVPDVRIAWRSTTGVPNGGVVTFHRIDDNRSRVTLQMDYQPQTAIEKLGDTFGAVKLTAKGNLKKFKQLVESRGTETGAWRGAVQAH